MGESPFHLRRCACSCRPNWLCLRLRCWAVPSPFCCYGCACLLVLLQRRSAATAFLAGLATSRDRKHTALQEAEIAEKSIHELPSPPTAAAALPLFALPPISYGFCVEVTFYIIHTKVYLPGNIFRAHLEITTKQPRILQRRGTNTLKSTSGSCPHRQSYNENNSKAFKHNTHTIHPLNHPPNQLM